jgi:hypothetical protein
MAKHRPRVLSISFILALSSFSVAQEKKPERVLFGEMLNEYGVLNASGCMCEDLEDGEILPPPELTVPEPFQYLRPDLQTTAAELTGEQRYPVLTEFKILTPEVCAGDEVRAVARVTSAYKNTLPFVTTFFSERYSRLGSATMYVNFEPSKEDKTLFLGRGRVSRYAPPGRYIVAYATISDDVGKRQSYGAEFHKPLNNDDGTPKFFMVGDNPRVDLRAPVLRKVEIETPSVRAGLDPVRFTVYAEDDVSGPLDAEAVWISPSEEQWIRVTMVHQGSEPGKFLGYFTIPRWYEGGEWRILRIGVTDDARNTAYYFSRTDAVVGQLPAVQVAQESSLVDKKAPSILAVSLSTTEARVGESVTVTALVEDELSGVRAVEGYVRSPHGVDALKVKLANEFVDLNRPSKIPEPNVWSATFKIKKSMERGLWTLVRLGAADQANNFHTYFEGRDPILTGITVNFVAEKGETHTEPTGGENR